MTNHCNETLFTTFSNLTPWVQGLTMIGVFVALILVAYLFTRPRRHIQEHVHYVAQGKPEG